MSYLSPSQDNEPERSSTTKGHSFESLGLAQPSAPHGFVSMSAEFPLSCGLCGMHANRHEAIASITVEDTSAVEAADPGTGESGTVEEITAYADSKGWWEPLPRIDDEPMILITQREYDILKFSAKLMLVVTEIAEAMEVLRVSGPSVDDTFYNENGKPEGFLVELVDADIRIRDIIGHLGGSQQLYDMARAIKHNYNRTRAHRHGGKQV